MYDKSAGDVVQQIVQPVVYNLFVYSGVWLMCLLMLIGGAFQWLEGLTRHSKDFPCLQRFESVSDHVMSRFYTCLIIIYVTLVIAYEIRLQRSVSCLATKMHCVRSLAGIFFPMR